MELDWTEVALVVIIVFVTIILLAVFCRWLRRDNEERAYRQELERRRHGFHMVQDTANMGVWEIWSTDDMREMQQVSPSLHSIATSTPPGECQPYHGNRRISNPRAKRVGSRLEAISE